MAVDEAILEASGSGAAPPTLRLYAWEPPCLSLGYAQPYEDADEAALRALGWEMVRRPTGGRAILHADELTYAICGPHDTPLLRGSVLESYRRIARILLRALQRLGIPAEARPESAAPAANGRKGPVCFETPSSYEITAGGRKLIGSAQARKRVGVLQHGSLPLGGDLRRITRVLRFPDEAARQRAARRLLARALTAEEAAGRPVSWEEAARALTEAFREVTRLPLRASGLTPEERARAGQILKEKYAHPGWTAQRAR